MIPKVGKAEGTENKKKKQIRKYRLKGNAEKRLLRCLKCPNCMIISSENVEICKDIGHIWSWDYFLKHFQPEWLQEYNLKKSRLQQKKNCSEQMEELTPEQIQIQKMCLQRANDFLKQARLLVKFFEPTCNPGKEYLKKKKIWLHVFK